MLSQTPSSHKLTYMYCTCICDVSHSAYSLKEKRAKTSTVVTTEECSQRSSRTLPSLPAVPLSGCTIGTAVAAWASALLENAARAQASYPEAGTAGPVVIDEICMSPTEPIPNCGFALDLDRSYASFQKEKTRLARAADLLDAAVRCYRLLNCHPSIKQGLPFMFKTLECVFRC